MRLGKQVPGSARHMRAGRAPILVAALVLLCATVFASAGITGYSTGTIISPQANAYRSRRTLSPMDYYKLPVCQPSDEVMKARREHPLIGDILTGNRLVPTMFEFRVGEDVKCATLCDASFTVKAVRRANYMINNDYYVRMFLDNKPLVSASPHEGSNAYLLGYPLGAQNDVEKTQVKTNIIHNHLDFTIRIKNRAISQFTGEEVVGFKVVARSLAEVGTCTATAFQHSSRPYILPSYRDGKDLKVPFTYSVTWERSNEEYPIEHRIGEDTQRRGHKIAALYGVLLTMLTGVVVAFVMLRTVRKDLAVYLDEELDEREIREESGWKLVRGDVFRPPQQAAALATAVGAGCQIAATMLSSVFLCAIHVVDSTHRGTFLSTVIALFLIGHVVSGFVTTRLLKLFGMATWKSAMCCMAAFPAALGGGVMLLNLIHWAKHSTAAIPFLTVVGIILSWLLISLPFGCYGIYWGFKMDTLAVTARVSSIPRLIPEDADSMTLYYVLAGSLVPFIACCVEIPFALNAFWREEPMYLYGFLTFFSIALVVLCAEVGIVVTYFTLRGEDYRWWWRSYSALATSGIHLFAYSILFLKRSLQIRALSSIILFLGYMLGASIMFGMALGSIGFIGSFWLVQKMYASIKAE
ncbi:transmembrane/endomembrane-like protein [Leishmania donovani]|uniref:Transmembrane 9 superfamily member n=1 Tax=Leishmania donovani TaxID=5661 RepID=E9BRE3_LEIDO|nr:transmembrane/endomembrane-like protein [Leishmania donovani]TPP40252.1 Endomembrane protein 70 family protein [Leishmania donovani]CBZ37822.1 transmembrane/endomembrane-like protein [Leishmania donovani]